MEWIPYGYQGMPIYLHIHNFYEEAARKHSRGKRSKEEINGTPIRNQSRKKGVGQSLVIFDIPEAPIILGCIKIF